MSGDEHPDGWKDLDALERGDLVAHLVDGIVLRCGRVAHLVDGRVGIREAWWVGWPGTRGSDVYVKERIDEAPEACVVPLHKLSSEQHSAAWELMRPRPLPERRRAP